MDRFVRHEQILSSSELFIVENVFAMKSWCKNKFSLQEDVIDKQFGIPEDFDYL